MRRDLFMWYYWLLKYDEFMFEVVVVLIEFDFDRIVVVEFLFCFLGVVV